MNARPPARTARLLARALRNEPAGAAMLGDLHEDFVRRARTHGALRARFWYRREAVILMAARLAAAASSLPSRWIDMRDVIRLHDVGGDVRVALRSIRRSPGLFAVLALVIGLGVGATASAFSVLRPLMLSPLPMAEPERLVWIEREGEESSLSTVTSRAIDLRDFRERSRSFAGLAGYNAFSAENGYTLAGGDGAPERLSGFGVTHDLLDVLGVRPLVGRNFTPEEGQRGGPPAVLLSHDLWQRRFGADRGIVGEHITLNDVPRTVVGVLPSSFDFASLFAPGSRVDFLVPYAIPIDARTGWQGPAMFFIGRLREGVSVAAADRELASIVSSLQAEDPRRWGLAPLRVMPLHEHVAGPFVPALRLLMLAAAAVMLIVCFNVANVLLARSQSRMRDVAIRKALGATRGRVLRQLLVETILLALPGAAVGILMAVLVTGFVTTSSALAIPLLNQVSVNASVLVVAVVSALFAGLAAGIAPALQLAEGGEATVLKSSAAGLSGNRAKRRWREGLVVAEIAVTCVLLVAGGLLLRSFQAVLDVELGFQSGHVVAWQLNPGRNFFELEERRAIQERINFYDELTARVAAVPGVGRVGLIDALPLGRNRTWSYRIVGEPERDEVRTSFPHIIDPGYLETLRIPLVKGRGFTAADDLNGRPVILVNETAAARMFPGRDPIGQRIVAGGADWEWEVIGVVADVRHVSPEDDPGLQIYFPMAQNPNFGTMDLVVRSRLPLETLTGAVSGALAELDPAMPTREFWTLEATLARTLSPRRFTLQVVAGFGIAALVLAALGIYGVLAHSVAERTREFGIRMALGASPGRIRHAVLGRTLLLAAAGIGIGLAAALSATGLLRSLLFGVSPTDPATIAGMAVVLVTVATLAGLVPARRATRAEALEALRGE